MDELADALRLDPAELRLRNDTQVDPERTLPFASRHLTGALREGAARFGWDKRRATPASVREGKVCWSRGRFRDPRRRAAERDGACPAGKRWPAGGRVGDDRHRDRHLHDPESIAAETMELPVSRITVRLGDTRYNRPGHRTRQVRHTTRSKELVRRASSWIAYQGERKHRHDRPRS